MKIHQLALKNCLVMPPMATAKSNPDGSVTEDICQYYKEKALYSKIGLIITEHAFICTQGKASDNQLSIADDSMIPGLKMLTDAVHETDVKIMAQINHAGSRSLTPVTGMEPVGPSALIHPNNKTGKCQMPQELTVDEIKALEEQFAQAALRAKLSGFDAVEIHAAHGYLLNQFYSPLTNHRTDSYGSSSLADRLRFASETIQAVRKAVGPDYPIAIRLGGCDYQEGGSTIQDCAEAAALLEQAGADMIDLTGGLFGYMLSGHTEPGYFKEMTIAAKKTTSLPVLLTGGVTRLSEAEMLLEEKAADLIGIGRAILKDSHWADEA